MRANSGEMWLFDQRDTLREEISELEEQIKFEYDQHKEWLESEERGGKMARAREILLEILEENRGKMDFNTLSKELKSRVQLGFGVETLDVVHALRKKNKIFFDEENEIVGLVPDK